MRKEIIEKIITHFEENTEVFNECIEELDRWNGYLGDDRYYFMEDLNDFHDSTEPIELLQRAFFGHDADTWHTDGHGEKIYGAFNPNREYFTYSGYGNLVSTDYKDYTAHLDCYFVEAIEEERGNLDSIEENEELKELFDELEGCEE